MFANFGELRAAVEDTAARGEVPLWCFNAAQRDISNSLNLSSMERSAAIVIGPDPVAMPADFGRVLSWQIDKWGLSMLPISSDAAGARPISPSLPRNYSLRGSDAGMTATFTPVPDGEMDTTLLYVVNALADFAADADTNEVLTTFPTMYLYGALHHVGLWQRDSEMISAYGAAFQGQENLARKRDDEKLNRRRWARTTRLRSF